MRMEDQKQDYEIFDYTPDMPQDEYIQTAVAFANADGGRIIFRLENNAWHMLDLPFQVYHFVANSIFEACAPPITPRMRIEEIDGHPAIIAEIAPGLAKPYYVYRDGITHGTYVRLAGVTRKASSTMIKELLLEGVNCTVDTEQANGEVSNEEIEALCERMYQHALERCHSEEERDTLPLLSADTLLAWKILIPGHLCHYPTVAWKLLNGDFSEQFPEVIIQMGVFQGTTRAVFLEKAEAYGPIDEQIEEAVAFVERHMDIDEDLLRDILAHAVLCRSYLAVGCIQVAIYDDRLEVTFPGMFAEKGQFRNPAVAAAFHYMHIIEQWGTWTSQVIERARQAKLAAPESIDYGTAFRINLYRHPGTKVPHDTAEAPDLHSLGAATPVIASDEAGSEFIASDFIASNEAESGHSASDLSASNEAESDFIASNEAESGVSASDFSASDEAQSEFSASNEAQSGVSASDTAAFGALSNIPTKMRYHAERILTYIQQNPHAPASQIGDDAQISRSTVQRIMAEMKRAGILSHQGSNRNGTWVITENEIP